MDLSKYDEALIEFDDALDEYADSGDIDQVKIVWNDQCKVMVIFTILRHHADTLEKYDETELHTDNPAETMVKSILTQFAKKSQKHEKMKESYRRSIAEARKSATAHSMTKREIVAVQAFNPNTSN